MYVGILYELDFFLLNTLILDGNYSLPSGRKRPGFLSNRTDVYEESRRSEDKLQFNFFFLCFIWYTSIHLLNNYEGKQLENKEKTNDDVQ